VDGLTGDACRERADLTAWLQVRGFTVDQIDASLSPMLLPANRVMGDDGGCISTREAAAAVGVDVELLQRFQRAAGLPRVEDPDAAVLPQADAEAVAGAKFLVDFGFDPDEAVAVVKVLTEGLARTAELMRQSTFKIITRPGMSEIEVAQSAEALSRNAKPFFGPLLEGLFFVQLRRMFETEAITASERATGRLPGARDITVGFADLADFTRLGEALPAEDLARMATRLAKLTHELTAPPVSFVKAIGDAVMLVSSDAIRLIETILDIVGAAAANDLPPLSAGVASGLAASRAGDWFGSPVNVASRITATARPGTVLVAESTREIAKTASDLVWTAAGKPRLRGVPGRTAVFRVSRA
jgi:adenylate cyclase